MSLSNGSGGGIRTHDQLITFVPKLPLGMDYIMIRKADPRRFPRRKIGVLSCEIVSTPSLINQSLARDYPAYSGTSPN